MHNDCTLAKYRHALPDSSDSPSHNLPVCRLACKSSSWEDRRHLDVIKQGSKGASDKKSHKSNTFRVKYPPSSNVSLWNSWTRQAIRHSCPASILPKAFHALSTCPPGASDADLDAAVENVALLLRQCCSIPGEPQAAALALRQLTYCRQLHTRLQTDSAVRAALEDVFVSATNCDGTFRRPTLVRHLAIAQVHLCLPCGTFWERLGSDEVTLLETCDPVTLTNVAWAAAHLDVPVTWQFLDALSSSAVRLGAHLNDMNICDLLWAIIILRRRLLSTPTQAKAAERSTRLLERATGEGLAVGLGRSEGAQETKDMLQATYAESVDLTPPHKLLSTPPGAPSVCPDALVQCVFNMTMLQGPP
jgi:hypothetical protein